MLRFGFFRLFAAKQAGFCGSRRRADRPGDSLMAGAALSTGRGDLA